MSAGTSDVLVIGAGILGAPIAYQLARAGYRVTVVDKGPGAGAGSTGASSAIVRYQYSTLTGVVEAWEAAHVWAALRDHLEAPAGEALPTLHRNGMVVLDVEDVPRQPLLGYFDQVGVPYEEWDADELLRRVPGIDPGRFYPPKPVHDEAFWDEPSDALGAVYTPDAGFVDDPKLAAEAFARAAARRGVELRFRSAVVGLAHAGGTWTATLADGSSLQAPIVVNAAGPWSPALDALAGVGAEFRVRNRPLRGEVHAVPAPPGFHPAGGLAPSIADLDLGYYLRPEPNGGLLIGSTDPACDPLEWVDDPDRVSLVRTAEAFERQVTRAARRFPALTIPARPSGIVGIYDVADDWRPIIDRTDAPGFYVAIGTSGNQFKNGPLIGELVATLVDAVENGHDHDRDPVQYTGRVTGLSVDLGAFSRLREPTTNAGTVTG
jgi:glycine/D-amino acid oxidase-like deaminating enzyme